MKKLLLLVLAIVLVSAVADAQLGKKYTVWGKRLMIDDSVRFSAPLILAASSFVGDSVVKTIAISGGQTTDKYFAQYTGTPGDSTTGPLSTTAYVGAFTVRRLAANAEANQPFIWFRSK